jgi:hypothetical protein
MKWTRPLGNKNRTICFRLGFPESSGGEIYAFIAALADAVFNELTFLASIIREEACASVCVCVDVDQDECQP